MERPDPIIPYDMERHDPIIPSLIAKYQALGAPAWELAKPCSGFATDAWKNSTGESLSCQWGPICNPTTLKESILDANGGIPHGGAGTTPGPNSSAGSSQSSGASSGSSSIAPFGSSF